VVNPYDTEELADSIRHALEMRPEERRQRMARMRTTVRENNIYRWAGNLIGELCEIRTVKTPPTVIMPRKAVAEKAMTEKAIVEKAMASHSWS
jgi:trehalose 6-phosphate synthase